MEYHIPPDTVVHDEVFAAAPSNLWHLPKEIWDKIWAKVEGEGVTVAVLDTGYTPHPDLPTPGIAKSFIPGQSVDDGNGHGTHCCGIAVGRNDVGVARKAKLNVYKVLSNSGSGGSDGIARAVREATDDGADVISMSLGSNSPDRATNDAIDYAVSKGVVVVVAAGNAGYNGADTIGWPGKHLNSICTGSYNKAGQISVYSSGGRRLDWACPGEQIISCNTRGGYVAMSGTSMATPFGAGLLALVISLMRREGQAAFTGSDAVRAFFEKFCEDKGEPGRDVRFGWGIPKAAEIVAALANDDIVWA